MANSSIRIPKAHLIMALCLPLAVLIGYMLADPMESASIAVLVLVLSVLAVPLILKWYHPLLVLSWNAAITPAFIPARENIWLPLAFIAVVIAILNRATNPDGRFLTVPSLNRPIFFFVLVIVATGLLTGGFGLRILGSREQGGKQFYELLGAFVGYFAISSKRVPVDKAALYAGLYFLPGMAAGIANLAFAAGPAFYFLYTIFSPEFAMDQITAAYSLGGGITRLSGLSFVGPAIYLWLLAKYGIRGVFDLGKPWRILLFAAAVAGGFFGGFRSVLVMFCLTFAILFFLEGLHRTRYLFGLAACLVAAAALLMPFANKLPLAVQRTLSVLPLNLDPIAIESAETSSEWRVDIWHTAATDIPKYFFRGKGYTLSPDEIQDAIRSHAAGDESKTALIVGNYHNGPLSVLIPFGVWGAVAFLWFIYAGGKFMYQAMRHGEERLRTINALLLAAFSARVIFFFGVFGSLALDMTIFIGLLAMSVCLNGQERKAATEASQELNALDEDAELAEA